MKRIRVLLADDHTIVRGGLRMLLTLEKDIQVVGEAADGAEALRLAGELKPHVVVMDIGMPVLNGVEATRKLLAADPSVGIIGLSIHSDRRFVLGMLAAGAKGYLLKNCAAEELVEAVRNVMEGRVHIGTGISGVMAEDYVRQVQGREEPTLLDLSEREREVARLLSLGRNNKQIASKLEVSVKTIETHRQHVMEKLGIHSIADLTRFAIREGLVLPDD